MFPFANSTCLITRWSKSLFGTIIFLIATSPFGNSADIIDVEDLVNPASFGGTIVSVSADGTTVVGTVNNGYENSYGFRWRAGKAIDEIRDLTIRVGIPDIRGVSDDGEIVFAKDRTTLERSGAGYWIYGMNGIYFPSLGTSIRAQDIVGVRGDTWFGSNYYGSTMSKRASVGGNNGGVLFGGYASTSFDNSGVGESNIYESTSIFHAYDPTYGSSNDADLGVLPGGTNSRAYSKRAGKTVGQSESTNGMRAFLIEGRGMPMQDIGVLPGKSTSSARLISADGYWIFGISDNTAFIWDSENGMRNLLQVLIDEGVNGIEGWSGLYTVDTVYGDSVNGYVLTGTGSNGRYIVRGLFAAPEPSTFTLTIIAGVLLWRSKKRVEIRNRKESRDFVKC